MTSTNNSYDLDAYARGARVAAESAGLLTISELRRNWLCSAKSLGGALKGKMKNLYKSQFSISYISRMAKPIAKPIIKIVVNATGNDIDEVAIDKTIDVAENGVRWVSAAFSTVLSKEVRPGVKQFCEDTVKLAKGIGTRVVEKVKTGGILSDVSKGIKSAWSSAVERAKNIWKGGLSGLRRVGEMIH